MNGFLDRRAAGKQLARCLGHLAGQDVIVLGLPRGGVPVAFEVARVLGAPLDVIVVRKLGVPHQPELAMGAVGEGGVVIRNDRVIGLIGIDDAEVEAAAARERPEVDRRARQYRDGRVPLSLEGRVAVVVDDGMATGSTARAACQVARARGASRVVLAVPVAPRASLDSMRDVADEEVAVDTPVSFFAVGQFYESFEQVSDDEVVAILRRADSLAAGIEGAPQDPLPRDEEVVVDAGGLELAGRLTIPEDRRGIVVFAHGSGSSRHSPRNRSVAAALQAAGFGTLLFDLLSPDEELDRRNVFDIELLAERLGAVTRWLEDQPEAAGVPLGYFGASTGGGAALAAAALPDSPVAAIVSRGGRPDLAGPWLPAVRAPTLLVVGSHDEVVLGLNRAAAERLTCVNRLELVPGATHLFEEPGALEQVSRLAAAWFEEHLTGGHG